MKYNNSIVDLAWEIIEMHRLIISQEQEIERLQDYKDKYNNLLDSNAKSTKEMANIVLKGLINQTIKEVDDKQNHSLMENIKYE